METFLHDERLSARIAQAHRQKPFDLLAQHELAVLQQSDRTSA
jgi:hypothetical protein